MCCVCLVCTSMFLFLHSVISAVQKRKKWNLFVFKFLFTKIIIIRKKKNMAKAENERFFHIVYFFSNIWDDHFKKAILFKRIPSESYFFGCFRFWNFFFLVFSFSTRHSRYSVDFFLLISNFLFIVLLFFSVSILSAIFNFLTSSRTYLREIIFGGGVPKPEKSQVHKIFVSICYFRCFFFVYFLIFYFLNYYR